MSPLLYAVITGDIRNSTRLPSVDLHRLPQVLKGIFDELSQHLQQRNNWLKYSIFRGDSFQIVTSPEAAVRVIIFIRAGLRSAFPRAVSSAVDCRAAIAIGTIGHLSDNITESSGEAFNLSGRLLESMGRPVLMKSVTPMPAVTDELNTELALCNEIVVKWTRSQARLIPDLFNNETQSAIAAGSGTSQAAVAGKIQAMGWYAVEQFINRFQTLCRNSFTQL